jgi:uncharacterized paraquat-inducible protein A
MEVSKVDISQANLKRLGLAFNLIALGLFFPGIIFPIFSLNIDMFASVMQTNIDVSLIKQELSILQSIEKLYVDQRFLVAGLIFFFSVCIPLLKTLFVCIAYIKRNTQAETKILNFIGAIGKWSMADVFVVAIFLAVLSTNQAQTVTEHQVTLFNFQLPVSVASQTLSNLGAGFYYFTGYCLLSLFGTHISLSTRAR